MLHVLRRHAVAEAVRCTSMFDAVHAAVAPVFLGEEGARPAREFAERMNRILFPPQPGFDPERVEQQRIFDSVAARAAAQSARG